LNKTYSPSILYGLKYWNILSRSLPGTAVRCGGRRPPLFDAIDLIGI